MVLRKPSLQLTFFCNRHPGFLNGVHYGYQHSCLILLQVLQHLSKHRPTGIASHVEWAPECKSSLAETKLTVFKIFLSFQEFCMQKHTRDVELEYESFHSERV